MSFSLSFAAPTDGAAVLSLAEAKAHLALEAADDWQDDLILALMDAAVSAAESFCNRRLAPVEVTLTADDFAQIGRGLGTGPVTALNSVVYDDAAGAQQTVPSTVYRLVHDRQIGLKPGQVWPSDRATDVPGTVRAVFTAGYDLAGADGPKPPPAMIAAVKLMLGHLYVNREALMAGGSITEMPLGFDSLLRPHRDPVL